MPQNNRYVEAEGTVAQATAAFGSSLGYYSYNGAILRSPEAALSVPASLASTVSAVVGLDEGPTLVHTNTKVDANAPPSAGFRTGTPCSAYWAEQDTTALPSPVAANPYGATALPLAPCGYTPQQTRGAYGLAPTATSGVADGTGQTVAIIDAYASPTIQSDLDRWSANRGISSTRITQVVAPGTFHHPESGGKNKQDPAGWYGEESLDVEAVHGMAPGAKIIYVGAPNNFQDLDAALNHVVDKGLAQIVTNSYGFPTEALAPGFIKAYEQTIEQGAAEGIGIYFSSGDNSDESLTVGYVTPDWPASSPFVTAVGGTSLAVGVSNNYQFETAWGTTTASNSCSGGSCSWKPSVPGPWLYGAGGGVSCLFPRAPYQNGVESLTAGPNSLCPGFAGRAVPDIAAIGDPNTGYLVGQTQTFPATSVAPGGVQYGEFRIGGTSLSSPIMAGIMAIADQTAGHAHGFANPLFYGLSGTDLHDIVHPASTVAVVRVNYVNGVDASAGLGYVLRTADQTLSLNAAPGYDDVTGMGTPGPSFISALSH
jgi:subtilase family serine protease